MNSDETFKAALIEWSSVAASAAFKKTFDGSGVSNEIVTKVSNSFGEEFSKTEHVNMLYSAIKNYIHDNEQ
jgi:hypothetical protein